MLHSLNLLICWQSSVEDLVGLPSKGRVSYEDGGPICIFQKKDPIAADQLLLET